MTCPVFQNYHSWGAGLTPKFTSQFAAPSHGTFRSSLPICLLRSIMHMVLGLVEENLRSFQGAFNCQCTWLRLLISVWGVVFQNWLNKFLHLAHYLKKMSRPRIPSILAVLLSFSLDMDQNDYSVSTDKFLPAHCTHNSWCLFQNETTALSLPSLHPSHQLSLSLVSHILKCLTSLLIGDKI